jgi:hypothetical protein
VNSSLLKASFVMPITGRIYMKSKICRELADRMLWDRLKLPSEENSMTNTVSYLPAEFKHKFRTVNHDHELKKVAVLLEKVRRQIAERELRLESPKPAIAVTNNTSSLPSRSALVER